jgi:hypothetical protein
MSVTLCDTDRLLKAYGSTEGPFGIPMSPEIAKAIEDLIGADGASLSAECRELIAAGPVRRGRTPISMEFQEGERADISVITTDSVDRDREVILPKGINTKQFEQAGMPVTFAHKYDELPIGRGLWIQRRSDPPRLIAKTHYHERPQDWTGPWLADAVVHLLKADGLRGKSIGFIPLKVHTPTSDEIKKNPEWADARLVYDEILLLEYAVAPIQSNPDALVQAVAKTKALGIEVPDCIFDTCGLIVPSPLLPEASPEAHILDENQQAKRPAAPPALTRQEIQRQVDKAIRNVLAAVPQITEDAIKRQRGQVS